MEKQKYVKKTQRELITLYKELLYNYFFDEFGNENGNKIYGDWLDKYRQQWQDGKKNSDLDDLIIKHELEPRYKKRILQKYKDKEKLLKPRFVTERCRYYNLPEPLDRVDWRTPYDNIFIGQEGNKKFCPRGGSGSSGSREKNSKFIYAFARLNKIKPIPSYLFIYSEENQLNFIKKFNQLTIPRYDIGENYHLDQKEHRKLLSDCQMISWKNFEVVNKILISKFV